MPCFFKNREQEGKIGPVWGLVPVGGDTMSGEGIGGRIWRKYCAHMYINGKMRTAETIPGVMAGGIKENDEGVNSTMIYYKK
jgi:hypothetical protein